MDAIVGGDGTLAPHNQMVSYHHCFAGGINGVALIFGQASWSYRRSMTMRPFSVRR